LAIDEARRRGAKRAVGVLVKVHHLWVMKIGRPEWSKLGAEVKLPD
jgi:hypothetical protein